MHDFSCSYLYIYISTYQTKLNQSILKKYDLRDYIKLLFLITHPNLPLMSLPTKCWNGCSALGT